MLVMAWGWWLWNWLGWLAVVMHATAWVAEGRCASVMPLGVARGGDSVLDSSAAPSPLLVVATWGLSLARNHPVLVVALLIAAAAVVAAVVVLGTKPKPKQVCRNCRLI